MRYLQSCKGFRAQGDKDSPLEEGTVTILENTDSVGKHVCTRIQRTEYNRIVCTNIYNKIMSNFKTRDIREPLGHALHRLRQLPQLATAPHLPAPGRENARVHADRVSQYSYPSATLSQPEETRKCRKLLAEFAPSKKKGFSWSSRPVNRRKTLLLGGRRTKKSLLVVMTREEETAAVWAMRALQHLVNAWR